MSDGITDRRSEPAPRRSLLDFSPTEILAHVASGYVAPKATTDDLIKTIKYLRNEVKKRIEDI